MIFISDGVTLQTSHSAYVAAGCEICDRKIVILSDKI